MLITFDRSEYHRSETIHCPCCSSQTHKNGTVSYFHQALFPAIVHPLQSSGVSLAPEFITPQDGNDKQDCETAAAKRWMTRHQSLFEAFHMTLLGDDLYSRHPLCPMRWPTASISFVCVYRALTLRCMSGWTF